MSTIGRREQRSQLEDRPASEAGDRTVRGFSVRSPGSAALFSALLAVTVFANSLGNGFARDDVPIIVENEAIHDLSDLPEILARPYWSGERGWTSSIWRPVSTAAFAVEWALWEDHPLGYHVVNVLMHGVATGLATLVLAHLIPLGAAFIGGLVFAVHPVHVEAVANVVGFSELLVSVLLLSAFLVFLRGRSETILPSRSVGLVTFLYGLAFLTKENAAVLPALFVLVDAWADRLSWTDVLPYLKRRFSLFASMGITAAAILLARFQVLGSIANPVPPLGAQLLEEIPRIWTLPIIWLNYLRLLFFPVDLIPDYSPGIIDVQLGWNAANGAGVVMVMVILVLAWVVWREERSLDPITLGILWFGLTILPVANVFFLTEILLAERTLYLPSLGLAMAVGILAWHVGRSSPRAARMGVLVVIVLLSLRTWTANPTWRHTGSIMSRLMAEHPEAGRAQWMWADILMDEERDPDRGLEIYRLAVSTTRGSYPVMHDATEDLLALGAFPQAAALAEIMWKDRPHDPRAPAQLATARSRMGLHPQVIKPALAAIELAPDNAVIHHLVATAYRNQGMWELALEHRREAIENGEGGQWQQWRWLAELQIRLGDTSAARASVDSARVRTNDSTAHEFLDRILGPGPL